LKIRRGFILTGPVRSWSPERLILDLAGLHPKDSTHFGVEPQTATCTTFDFGPSFYTVYRGDTDGADWRIQKRKELKGTWERGRPAVGSAKAATLVATDRHSLLRLRLQRANRYRGGKRRRKAQCHYRRTRRAAGFEGQAASLTDPSRRWPDSGWLPEQLCCCTSTPPCPTPRPRSRASGASNPLEC
jgi:hypothetical protein